MLEYILKIKTKKIIPIDILFKEEKNIKINIIIYHITINSLYPFVQFMLYKTLNNNLILPFLYLNYDINIYNNLKNIIIKNIIKYLIMIKTLNNIYLNEDNINKNIIYDGIILDDNNNIYICIDISNININNILLNSNSLIIFSLYSEIVNQGNIYDMKIDEELIYNFSKSCYFGLLKDSENNENEYYPFPQVVYYCNNKNITELYSILGYFKEKIYENLDEYLFFHKESNKSLKYFKEKNNTFIKEEKIVINRISLFIENDAIYEYNKNDVDIKYNAVSILFTNNINNYLPNVLVKNNLYINTLSLLII